MSLILVLTGLVLSGVAIVLRLLPHVVTGISLFSVLQLMGLLLLLYAWFRRRYEFSAWVKRSEIGKYVRVLCVLIWLLPAIQLFEAVVSEMDEGRHYDRVAILLVSDRQPDALTLASFLPVKVTESAPLRERILAHLAELDFRHPDVTGPVRLTIRDDPDRQVRTRAVETLARLMTPREVFIIVRDLERQEAATRQLYVQALAAGTGQEIPNDPAAWRKWFGDTFAEAEPAEAFALAIRAYRDPGDHPALRAAAYRRIRSGLGSDVETLRELAEDRSSAEIRAAAAGLLVDTKDRKLATFLGLLLLKETDAAAAAVQAAGIRSLDPEGADRRLFDVAERARPGPGRKAARVALIGEAEIDENDPTALTVFFFRKQTGVNERRDLFEVLLRKADQGEAARWELRRLACSEEEPDNLRIRSLNAALEADQGVLTDGDLIDLFDKKGGREFKEAVRAALRKRTGKDAGRDAKAWRDALK